MPSLFILLLLFFRPLFLFLLPFLFSSLVSLTVSSHNSYNESLSSDSYPYYCLINPTISLSNLPPRFTYWQDYFTIVSQPSGSRSCTRSLAFAKARIHRVLNILRYLAKYFQYSGKVFWAEDVQRRIETSTILSLHYLTFVRPLRIKIPFCVGWYKLFFFVFG